MGTGVRGLSLCPRPCAGCLRALGAGPPRDALAGTRGHRVAEGPKEHRASRQGEEEGSPFAGLGPAGPWLGDLCAPEGVSGCGRAAASESLRRARRRKMGHRAGRGRRGRAWRRRDPGEAAAVASPPRRAPRPSQNRAGPPGGWRMLKGVVTKVGGF